LTFNIHQSLKFVRVSMFIEKEALFQTV